ncbi:hypothetical protein D5W64_12890 [Salmonella enterica subsp. enterica serovar Saintpaul]|nr:hypothetical protein [Salmonella enterica subsp. enterica serovar Saintpaul]
MLNNIEFKAYVKNTIAFARTIVIKCNDIALSDNRLMEQHYGLVPDVDPAKWRYYMNLNGEYHITDEKMYVQSLDNGDTIEFTKANLDLHLATKRAYREGSYYYSRLVEKYPAQSILINGVINPIPQTESVPAKDYQILRYNKDYVEWNEYQLIPALQQHIDAMVEGSFDTEYLYTDNLMLPLLLSTLHGSLVSNILMLRKEAAFTRYAHSFYVWSKLMSVGISSVYKNYLDRKQTMWLFRNVDYVLRKLGRRATFDDVLNILLTHRRIPLSRYETIQTTEDMETTFVPKPMMLSTPINLINDFGMDTRLYTVPEVIAKENPLAIDNLTNYENGEEATSYAIKYGLFGDVPSKVLESNMTDTTDRNPDRLMRVLHNEWIYLTFNKLYNINIDVPDARSGSKIRLTMPQAIILWHYLIDRSRGIDRPGEIPEYNYWHVRKLVDPTWQELRMLGGKEILTEDVCKNILKIKVDFPNLITPDGFFNKCKEVQNAMWDHKKLYSRVLNLFFASRRKNAVDACYADGLAKFGTWKTYDDFLLTLDLDVWTYNQDECLELAWSIWSKATGWEFNDVQSIGEQQRMLINLMKDLTSYTVQYVGSTETLEGQFNLPYMVLLDGDYHVDGDTSLIHDPGDIFIPLELRGTVNAYLDAEIPIGSLPGPNWGVPDAELIGSAKIPLVLNITPIEYKPLPSVNIISNALTLKEDKTHGQTPAPLP